MKQLDEQLEFEFMKEIREKENIIPNGISIIGTTSVGCLFMKLVDVLCSKMVNPPFIYEYINNYIEKIPPFPY